MEKIRDLILAAKLFSDFQSIGNKAKLDIAIEAVEKMMDGYKEIIKGYEYKKRNNMETFTDTVGAFKD